MDKPTIPEVIERFRTYYRAPGNGAWGSLHVVLDDGNVRDDHVRGCIEWAIERSDKEGEELARILLRMSKTQRGKISSLCFENDAAGKQ